MCLKRKQNKEKYHLPYSALIDVGHNKEADDCGCVGSFSAQIWSISLTKEDYEKFHEIGEKKTKRQRQKPKNSKRQKDKNTKPHKNTSSILISTLLHSWLQFDTA